MDQKLMDKIAFEATRVHPEMRTEFKTYVEQLVNAKGPQHVLSLPPTILAILFDLMNRANLEENLPSESDEDNEDMAS